MKEIIQAGDFGASIDATDAYFHIQVTRRSSQLMRFFFKDKVYEFVVLPFGLTCRQELFYIKNLSDL